MDDISDGLPLAHSEVGDVSDQLRYDGANVLLLFFLHFQWKDIVGKGFQQNTDQW